jgi:hypothetical protein
LGRRRFLQVSFFPARFFQALTATGGAGQVGGKLVAWNFHQPADRDAAGSLGFLDQCRWMMGILKFKNLGLDCSGDLI